MTSCGAADTPESTVSADPAQAGTPCGTEAVTHHTAAHLLQLEQAELVACAAELSSAVRRGSYIYTCGNGGSATSASHLACDLSHPRREIAGRRARVRCVYDIAMTTATANDFGYDQIFTAPLEPVLEENDVVVAISFSGMSPNILRALQLSRQRGATTISLLGRDGGKAFPLSDFALAVHCDDPGVVESVHLAVIHELAARAFAPQDAAARTSRAALPATRGR
jgi:D-sedoheptulose 7-phosphate isomerase